MRAILLIILGCLLITACNKNRVPEDVLPPEKMEAVLWDLMRMDQFLSDFAFKDTSVKPAEASVRAYGRVLAIHKITQKEFRRSFDYYNAHPSLLKPVIDSIAAIPVPSSITTPALPDTAKQKPARPLFRPDSLLKTRNRKPAKVE